ncbi:MAG: 16S rRNA (guanine(966)-N(2))-methyltransferase RsmD [Roseibacillus sp.]|jgi:16S rRNA (guanine966-N2)-methyltransferase|nr:16S rRNA (guanine(966)-N(2))-methyltransferase RsmD [Roseibacillus sp.]
MRVIAGRARGMRLKVPPRATRPSTDRLREALFSILQVRLEGARVLDLFAGSGALGIEALSRGAQEAVFVEASGAAGRILRENLEKARFAGQGTVHQRDVFAYLGSCSAVFDLILADPPYLSNADHDLAGALMEDASLPSRLSDGGLVVLEVEAEREEPAAPGWKMIDRRKYGSSAILFYAREESR